MQTLLRKFLIIAVVITGFSCRGSLPAQENGRFNVNLALDFTAAEQSVELFNDQLVSTHNMALLRGNVIAASTSDLIAGTSAASRLQDYLDSLRYHQIIREDIYHLEKAKQNSADIAGLLREMKRRNFSERVTATVAQIFPGDAVINLTIPVYVVAMGHQNVDAFVRRIVWHGDTPSFTGGSDGELTIVINLAHAVEYGMGPEDRFISLLGVVAHEVFHAAFAGYKETAPSWKRFYRKHTLPFDALLDITQNEGIAYYLSIDQEGRGRLPRDWNSRMRESFDAFNRNGSELLSASISPERAQSLLRKANLSGFWESYGAMTGMFVARQIDLKLGRGALISALGSDPYTFFQVYCKLTAEDSNLPRFSEELQAEILKN